MPLFDSITESSENDERGDECFICMEKIETPYVVYISCNSKKNRAYCQWPSHFECYLNFSNCFDSLSKFKRELILIKPNREE